MTINLIFSKDKPLKTSMVSVMVGAFILGGCQTRYANVASFDPLLANYDKRHPILLAEEEDTLELYIGSGSSKLTSGDRSALANYVRKYKANGDSGLTILVPAGAANEMAAGSVLSDIRKVVHSEGINTRAVAVTSYQVQDIRANAPIRIIYNRVSAVTNPCGHVPADLSGNLTTTFENKDYWDYGCSSQNNLAAMLDDPRDAVRTRGMGKADAARRMQVLDSYRTGSETGAADQGGADAAVSEVAN